MIVTQTQSSQPVGSHSLMMQNLETLRIYPTMQYSKVFFDQHYRSATPTAEALDVALPEGAEDAEKSDDKPDFTTTGFLKKKFSQGKYFNLCFLE